MKHKKIKGKKYITFLPYTIRDYDGKLLVRIGEIKIQFFADNVSIEPKFEVTFQNE